MSSYHFLAPTKLSMQRRNYASCSPACCLPPPCNTPPRCLQFMSGYYYYPYGTWFCGPYHDAKVCPISKGACCCTACLAAQGAVANAGMMSPALQAPMSNYCHAATTWNRQAAQMAQAAMSARAQSSQAAQIAQAAMSAQSQEAAAQEPETIPVELPSKAEKPETPPESNTPVKPPHFSRFYPFP